MNTSDAVHDPQLERQGRRMVGPALRFLAVGALLAVPGIVLIVIGSDGWLGLGIALIFLASCPAVIGLGLVFSGSVARWAARHKLFA